MNFFCRALFKGIYVYSNESVVCRQVYIQFEDNYFIVIFASE